MPKKQNIYNRLMAKLNTLQQSHAAIAIPYAVIKKAGDDRATYLAALISYYGFISLFPLLIVATSVIQLIAANDELWRAKFLEYATSYFPAIGGTLADSINTPSRSGLVLIIGIIVALYGARGIIIAVQHAIDEVWMTKPTDHIRFPRNVIKGTPLIFWAGLGFISSAALIGYATAEGHSLFLRLGLGVAGFAILLAVFWGIMTVGGSKRHRAGVNMASAFLTATGLLALQTLGGYIVTQQLQHQVGLNAQIGFVLVMLFWLYLQALLFVYAIELTVVRNMRLWPRSMQPEHRSAGDIRAHKAYSQRESYD